MIELGMSGLPDSTALSTLIELVREEQQQKEP